MKPVPDDVIVRLEAVSHRYEKSGNGSPALQDINIVIRRGEFIALVGPSGSGKTTLLNMIGALDRPQSGRIWIHGRDTSQCTPTELATIRLKEIGFVFQDHNLVPVLTALENMEFVLLLQGISVALRRKRAFALMDELGLAGMENRLPGELSGGQQQRVAIGRAIASQPKIVLLDEPTANLDSATGASLLDLLREMNEQIGTTFVFSTHDPMIMARARRVVHLRDGRLISDLSQG